MSHIKPVDGLIHRCQSRHCRNVEIDTFETSLSLLSYVAAYQRMNRNIKKLLEEEGVDGKVADDKESLDSWRAFNSIF